MILLFKDNFFATAIPMTGPILVCPADAKWKIETLIRYDGLEGLVERATRTKIVIIDAETRDTVSPSEGPLPLKCLPHSEIIEAEIRWQVRLIMADVSWRCLRYVRPLGKPLPPIKIIFGRRVILRKVKCDHA